MRPWVALFSQTGTEIANISVYHNITPSLLITTRKDVEDANAWIKKQVNENGLPIVYLPKNTTASDYNSFFKNYSNPLITLHGFLRIIPKKTCKEYEMYNLHPGLITKYPELKGKDPQERAWQAKHLTAGCVIHRVIPEVDEGEILVSREIDIRHNNRDRIYTDLHSLGSVMWCHFFEEYVKSGNNKSSRETISEHLSGVS